MTKTVSIVIPSMNEETGIGFTIDELPISALSVDGYETEIVVVDGNSKDNTVAVAESKGARVIIEPRRGYGRAYKTGFQKATGDYIVTMDADGTYPSEMIPALLDYLITNNLDFVTTNRFANLRPKSMTHSHIVGNKILSFVGRLAFGIKLRDSQSGMWVFKRSLLRVIGISSDGMGFSQEFKIRAFQNAACREVPIYYRRRIGEEKLSTLSDGYSNLKEMIGLIWRAPEVPLLSSHPARNETLAKMTSSPILYET